VERSATEGVVKATKTANRSETDRFAKADRETKTLSEWIGRRITVHGAW
jgi:hypothetical protein